MSHPVLPPPALLQELRKALASAEAALKGAKDDLFDSEMERRRLHNMIQVRARPCVAVAGEPPLAWAIVLPACHMSHRGQVF